MIVFVLLFFVDVLVFISAVVFSRIVFDRYLRREHRSTWETLNQQRVPVDGQWLATDATLAMAEFRAREDEDCGDPRLRLMKRRSKQLYRWAIGLWLVLVLLFFTVWMLGRMGVLEAFGYPRKQFL